MIVQARTQEKTQAIGVRRCGIVSLPFLDGGSYPEHYNHGCSKIFVWAVNSFSTRKQTGRDLVVILIEVSGLRVVWWAP